MKGRSTKILEMKLNFKCKEVDGNSKKIVKLYMLIVIYVYLAMVLDRITI